MSQSLVEGATTEQILNVQQYSKVTVIVRSGGTNVVAAVGPDTGSLTTLATLTPVSVTTYTHSMIILKLTPTGTTFDVIASTIA